MHPSHAPNRPARWLLQIMGLNESPVFLLLNPKVDVTRKDLPVSLYETGVWEWGGEGGARGRGGGEQGPAKVLAV